MNVFWLLSHFVCLKTRHFYSFIYCSSNQLNFCRKRFLGNAVHNNHYTHTHTFKALFPGLPGWASTRKAKPIWIFYWSKRQWRHLYSPIYTPIFYLLKLYTAMPVQTDNHASTPPHSFFTGRMPFLPPSQQHQSTEGTQPPLRGNYAGQPALAGNFN